MLVTPGAAAYLLTDKFSSMMRLASIIGVLTSSAGAYISYFLNGSAGGCIVTLQFLFFLVVLFFAPRHGILAAKLNAAKAVRAFFAKRTIEG